MVFDGFARGHGCPIVGEPGDLPIEMPSKFDLVINVNAAKELGLSIPSELLLRADAVIR